MINTKTNKQTTQSNLLKPLPGRLFSVAIAVACLVLLWGGVLSQQAPRHSVSVLLLITSALSSFHAFGWRPKYYWEKYLLSPIGSLILLLFTLWFFLW